MIRSLRGKLTEDGSGLTIGLKLNEVPAGIHNHRLCLLALGAGVVDARPFDEAGRDRRDRDARWRPRGAVKATLVREWTASGGR
jgi:hypothetical protein